MSGLTARRLLGKSFTIALAGVVLKFFSTPSLGELEPVDLRGRTFIVTGATAGLGMWQVETLAKWNATLVIPVRNVTAGRALAERLESYGAECHVYHMDLSSLASVRKFAEEYKGPVDVLVHNAAILGSGELVRTSDGYEECFQVNYLSTFLLTQLLLERIEKSKAGRIVHVSAEIYKEGNISAASMRKDKVADAGFVSRQGSTMGNLGGSYADSKLAQVLFNGALARRLKSGTVTLAIHPSINMHTDLARDLRKSRSVLNQVIDVVFPIVARFVGFVQSDEDAPKVQIHVSTHPALQHDEVSGLYYSALRPPLRGCGRPQEDCGVEALVGLAREYQLAEDVFTASCELLGLSDGMCGRKHTITA